MDRQLSIDFDRARQLGLIKDWRPQTVGQVSGLTLKAVLAQINHYGRGRICFVSQARLCQECGIGERTCRRAISVLQQLGVLIAIRTHAAEGTRLTRNQYRIVWTELEVIVERQGRYQSARANPFDDPSATSADPTVSCAVQRATSADHPTDFEEFTESLGRHPSSQARESNGLSVSCAEPTVSCAVQRTTSVDQLTPERLSHRPAIGADRPDTRSYQQAIWDDQQAIRDDQQAIRDDQQATSGRLHGITLPETKNYTAPLPPKVDPDLGGRMAAEDFFERENPSEPEAVPSQPGLRPGGFGQRQPASEIERLLADAGVELWARCAAEFAHLGPQAVRDAIATYEANRAKLKGPQAIVYALRNGVWPAKGLGPVKPPDPPEVVDARRREESRRRQEQFRETRQREIILQGRRQRLSDFEIGQRLRAAGLDASGFLNFEPKENET